MKSKLDKARASYEKDWAKRHKLVEAESVRISRKYAPLIPRVYVKFQSKLEKEKAQMLQQLVDYTYNSAIASKILKTPWGVLMWTPKENGK